MGKSIIAPFDLSLIGIKPKKREANELLRVSDVLRGQHQHAESCLSKCSTPVEPND